MASIIKVGNLEFEQLVPDELRSIPIGVQALDNQWLPRKLLTRAMKYGIERVEEQLNEMVRSEYIRALINGEQVIINRAFLYNNSAIIQDYSVAGKSREAFKTLLQDGVIIPSLYIERTHRLMNLYQHSVVNHLLKGLLRKIGAKFAKRYVPIVCACRGMMPSIMLLLQKSFQKKWGRILQVSSLII